MDEAAAAVSLFVVTNGSLPVAASRNDVDSTRRSSTQRVPT